MTKKIKLIDRSSRNEIVLSRHMLKRNNVNGNRSTLLRKITYTPGKFEHLARRRGWLCCPRYETMFLNGLSGMRRNARHMRSLDARSRSEVYKASFHSWCYYCSMVAVPGSFRYSLLTTILLPMVWWLYVHMHNRDLNPRIVEIQQTGCTFPFDL